MIYAFAHTALTEILSQSNFSGIGCSVNIKQLANCPSGLDEGIFLQCSSPSINTNYDIDALISGGSNGKGANNSPVIHGCTITITSSGHDARCLQTALTHDFHSRNSSEKEYEASELYILLGNDGSVSDGDGDLIINATSLHVFPMALAVSCSISPDGITVSYTATQNSLHGNTAKIDLGNSTAYLEQE